MPTWRMHALWRQAQQHNNHHHYAYHYGAPYCYHNSWYNNNTYRRQRSPQQNDQHWPSDTATTTATTTTSTPTVFLNNAIVSYYLPLQATIPHSKYMNILVNVLYKISYSCVWYNKKQTHLLFIFQISKPRCETIKKTTHSYIHYLRLHSIIRLPPILCVTFYLCLFQHTVLFSFEHETKVY